MSLYVVFPFFKIHHFCNWTREKALQTPICKSTPPQKSLIALSCIFLCLLTYFYAVLESRFCLYFRSMKLGVPWGPGCFISLSSHLRLRKRKIYKENCPCWEKNEKERGIGSNGFKEEKDRGRKQNANNILGGCLQENLPRTAVRNRNTAPRLRWCGSAYPHQGLPCCSLYPTSSLSHTTVGSSHALLQWRHWWEAD